MKTKNYIRSAKRTDVQRHEYLSKKFDLTAQQIRILHMALGLTTEAAEIADEVKKNLMYSKDLDLIKMKEELGDLLWYCANLIDELGTNFEEVFEQNIKKLRKRYPAGFSEKKALNRNPDAERAAMTAANMTPKEKE